MPSIGIVLLATNAYFLLGIRFIKKFTYHYKGNYPVKFYFFSDTDPKEYLPENIDIVYHHQEHLDWVSGTNAKFKNILLLENSSIEYLYYFDADTNIIRDFDQSWFLGDLVGGEHYGNRDWLKDGAGFEKNPKSRAYVPAESSLPKVYYYGAFFGGKTDRLIHMCKILYNDQLADWSIDYEPGVNDESFLNRYFHFNPPTKTIACTEFMFVISDKGGLIDTRDVKLDIIKMKEQLAYYKDQPIEIQSNQVFLYASQKY